MISQIIALTQYNGAIVGPVAKVLAYIINAIYSFFSIFGIENAALCIVLFTFILRAFMVPLYYRQQKAGKLTSKMNPELTAIQAKYKGKRDPESQKKMQLETQAVYEKYGSNPLSGCLPLLITFPIMLGLYRIVLSMPAYMPAIKDIYTNIANQVMNQNDYVNILTEIADSKTVKLVVENGAASLNSVIDVLSIFNNEKWKLLAEKFPQIAQSIAPSVAEIGRINNVFGIFSVSDTPSFTSNQITLIIPFLAGVLQFINGKQMMKSNTVPEGNNQAASINKNMTNFMPIMQAVFCLTFPIGVGVYWIAGSAFSIIQQYFFNKALDKVNVEEMIKKNQEKAAKARAKRGDAPDSKNFNKFANTSTRSIASMDVKNISSVENKEAEKTEKTKGSTIKTKGNYKITDYKKKDGEYKASNISDVANMLKRD